MTTDQAVAFVLFAVVAAVTPGPSNIIKRPTKSYNTRYISSKRIIQFNLIW